ncbi:flippase-like domain-containing protein [Sediminibacterium roseum]|uniref:Flippase-like domain-containing protein n=1 Tax=Sediminibacterium roseum TaxID=1978412 RepID=A0ABX0A018_9BACT|nr:lysylphosphatidylglycerol synthase transmembrane domain-containing protein [Sediminibacterium roseum]NCI51874.1 flippase-like domain-containing protein [Sediminibacterium roseum]
MNSKLYKAVFLLIGIATLGYMIHVIGYDVIWHNILKTGWWFIPITGIWLIVYIFNALAFRIIIHEPGLKESNIPFLTVLRITISGYAINYITPFVALGGEPYRIMELKKFVGTNKATSSVLLYGLMHMFSHLIFWLLSIILIIFIVPLDNMLLFGCGIAFLIGILVMLWFLKVYKNGFTISTFRLLQRIPYVRRWAKPFAEAKAASLAEIDEQIRILYTERKTAFYNSLILEILSRIVTCLEIYFAALAIGLNMSFMDSLIISSASSLFANLIFFLPMQLGTREGGLVLALKSMRFPGDSGIFIGLITRVRELVWIAIGLMLIKTFRRSNPGGE